MTTKRTVLTLLGAVAVVCAFSVGSSTISSSGSVNFNAALNHPVGDITGEGGTLTIGSTRVCDSFDPAMSYDSWCAVILRTYSRNLMSYANKPGKDGFVISPDLLKSAPHTSDGGTTWSATLRPNVKWDDGTALTSTDVQYSVERLFEANILGTVSNDYLCLLSACSSATPDYKGPSSSGDIKSIATPSPDTIIFTLTRPFPTFSTVLAMPQFGIVEKARVIALEAKGQTYSSAPASSGPYIVTPDSNAATFSRNPQWSQSTDGIRIPQVDAIEWKIFPDSDAANNAVISGQIDLRVDGGLTGDVADTALASKSTRKYLDLVGTGAVDYLALVATSQPLDRQACREAIFYALNKSDLLHIYGGQAGAKIATSMISQGLLGGDSDSNMYPSGSDNTGDLDAARNKLSECGYPDGFETTMAYVNLGLGKAAYESVQRSLARVGIVVDPNEFASFADYFASGVGNPDNVVTKNIGLIAAGWSPESGQSESYWGPIVDGRKIKLRSNVNYANIADDVINASLDALETGTVNVAKTNQSIDKRVMSQAVYLPFIKEQALLYRGPQLTNVYVQSALGGEYDLVNIGLNRQ